MPRTTKHIPWYIGWPMYHAIRASTALAGVGNLGAVLRLARTSGRFFGSAGFNKKRLARAVENLSIAYPNWSAEQYREHALRSYEHLFMLGTEMIYAPRLLTLEGWSDRVEIFHMAPLLRAVCSDKPVIFISGHCGNWEISGFSMGMLGFPMHALYRPLDLEPMDAWVRQSRERSGMILVDKFGAMKSLPAIMEARHPLAFVADQNAGDRGLFVPFFNRLASTYKAIGLLATRYNAVIAVGFAKRKGSTILPGTDIETEPQGLHYRMEAADVFGPEEYLAQPDPLFYIAARYRRAIEKCVHMAPDQYLWMHRYWKSRPRHERMGKPFPKPLLEKLRQLPWMTDDDLARIVEHSRRDTLDYAAKHRPGEAPEPEEAEGGEDEMA